MLKTKKRANTAQQEREERASLLESRSNRNEKHFFVPTPPSSGNSIGFRSRRDKRKTSNVVIAEAHPESYDVERVSLLTRRSSEGDAPLRPPKNAFRIASQKRRQRYASLHPPWTARRMIKYFGLMLVSCSITFWLLRKKPKEVQWDELKNLLEPAGHGAARCFVSTSVVELLYGTFYSWWIYQYSH